MWCVHDGALCTYVLEITSIQLEPEMIALSEEMARDEYKPSSFKFLFDEAAVSKFSICQVSNTPT